MLLFPLKQTIKSITIIFFIFLSGNFFDCSSKIHSDDYTILVIWKMVMRWGWEKRICKNFLCYILCGKRWNGNSIKMTFSSVWFPIWIPIKMIIPLNKNKLYATRYAHRMLTSAELISRKRSVYDGADNIQCVFSNGI